MSSDHTSLEEQLKNLRTTRMEPGLLQRLESCMEESWDRLSDDEIRAETSLRSVKPRALGSEFAASLESIVSKVPFPADGAAVIRVKPRSRFFPVSAAAAVALAGALTALLLPLGESGGPEPASTRAARLENSPSPPRHTGNSELVPAGYSRDLSEASDQGVVWPDKNRPHRVVKVVYTDEYTLKDKNGRTYQIKKPRVEYVLVPARTD